jgi:hypothetical protein
MTNVHSANRFSRSKTTAGGTRGGDMRDVRSQRRRFDPAASRMSCATLLGTANLDLQRRVRQGHATQLCAGHLSWQTPPGPQAKATR